MTTRKVKQDATALNERAFRFRGRDCVMKLTSPLADEYRYTMAGSAGILWEFSGGLAKLKSPQRVRGHYVPATFSITGLGFDEFTFSIKLNAKQPKDASAIVLDEINIRGDNNSGEMILPLDRMRVYAVQLAGVFGTAYPPNFREYYADGVSYYDAGDTGSIEVERYGYRVSEKDAADFTARPRRNSGIVRDELLRATAKSFSQYAGHHGRYQYIADELNKQFPNAVITYRNAKELVANCRSKEIGLLPPTGRTRKKTITKKTITKKTTTKKVGKK